jgi:hypothetical protein
MALRDDTRELKEAVKGFQNTCNCRHGDIQKRVGRIEHNYVELNRDRKLFLGGLAIALTGAVKGLFDWLTK